MMRLRFRVLVATLALLPCPLIAGQQGDLPKPEYIGVVYYLDPSAKLLALDREIPRAKVSLKALGLGGAKAVVEIDGLGASLRVPSDSEQTFVVELPTGIDPRKLQLYPLAVKNKNRQLVISSGSLLRGHQVRLSIQINISRYGENSYKLSPGSRLAVGEYAFMAEDTTEVFCFGVDRRQ